MDAQFRPGRLRRRRSAGTVHSAIVALATVALAAVAGCSLVTMAGKSLFGDPVVECAFKKVTKVDLTDSKQEVLVLCTVPESVNSEYPAINQRILEAVTRKMKGAGIKVVDANRVLTWLDDRNGVWSNADELAADFDAAYIIHIDLSEFTHKAENSPGMYQGKTMGEVHAYKVVKRGETKRAQSVFEDEYRSDYPANHPVSKNQRSAHLFLNDYIARISMELSWRFYDHPAGDGI